MNSRGASIRHRDIACTRLWLCRRILLRIFTTSEGKWSRRPVIGSLLLLLINWRSLVLSCKFRLFVFVISGFPQSFIKIIFPILFNLLFHDFFLDCIVFSPPSRIYLGVKTCSSWCLENRLFKSWLIWLFLVCTLTTSSPLRWWLALSIIYWAVSRWLLLFLFTNFKNLDCNFWLFSFSSSRRPDWRWSRRWRFCWCRFNDTRRRFNNFFPLFLFIFLFLFIIPFFSLRLFYILTILWFQYFTPSEIDYYLFYILDW